MSNDFDNDKCRTDIFDNGEFVVALDIPKIQANALCRELTSKSEDYDFDWQYTGGRVCIRQLKRKDKGEMKEFVSKQSRVLDDYESYHTFTLHCYGMGAVIHSKQDQVVKSSGEIKNYSSQVVTGLTNDEVVALRDYLIIHYPIEAQMEKDMAGSEQS